MGLFGKKKDWNIIAVMFETKGKYNVNGNRAQGAAAEKIKQGVSNHERTIFWAVFDQKRSFLEGKPGHGSNNVPAEMLSKLMRELPTIKTVQEVLATLEGGDTEKVARALAWE